MSQDENAGKAKTDVAKVEADKESKVEEVSPQEEEEEQQQVEETEADRIGALEERVLKLEEENSTLKDQYLRKQADFENFRKRMIREKEEAIKYANSVLLLDIVSIIDDFERAIKSSQDSKDFESFYSGIELIEKQFTGMLERKWGLVRFESEGQTFDPEKHEAIAMEERDTDTQIVLEDYQKGYMLHDRVLRHAKVKVSSPVTKESSDSVDDTTGDDEIKEEKK